VAALTTIWFGCANACRRARQVRRLADDRGLRCGSFADLVADDHRSGGDADPHRELDPGRSTGCGIQLRHRIDDAETRTHRSLGLVLMGARVAEIDENAVAHVLRDKPVVAPDRRAAPVLKRRDHIAQIFGVHPGRERGRPHQVAEHYGQLASLRVRRCGDRRRGSRSFGLPQGRQWLQQRRGLGSGHASLGPPDEKLAVDIRRHPLDDDQLTTQFFETVIIETKAELDPAIGDAALGDEAPEDLFQDLIKVHASALVRRDLRGRCLDLV